MGVAGQMPDQALVLPCDIGEKGLLILLIPSRGIDGISRRLRFLP